MTGAFVLGEVAAYWSGNVFLLWSGVFLLSAGLLWASAERGSGPEKSGKQERAGAGVWGQTVEYGHLSFLLLLVFLFCTGWGRMAWEKGERPLERYLISENEAGSSLHEGKKAVVRGTIAFCSEREEEYRLELSGAEVILPGQESEMVFREPALLVTVRKTTADRWKGDGPLCCGTGIEVSGKVSLFSGARNPGQFDDRLYYRGKKIRCRLRAEEIRTAEEMEGGSFRRPALYLAGAVREWIGEALSEVSCEEDRGIFQAVLLGDRTGLSGETKELFQDNGIAHILAVSGLHVSLIGMALYRLLRYLGLGYGAAGGAAASVLLFYGSVTGFSSSVFRAIFMVLCAFLAAYLGRTYDLLSAMALSLLLQAADSPYLLYSGGLQLSYASVLAVGLAQELWQQSGEKKQTKKRRWEGLRMGAMIQQITLPIVLYHFFKYPLWGIFLNLMVIPLLSFAVGSGIAAVGLYTVHRVWSGFSGKTEVLSLALGTLASVVTGPGHYIFAFYRLLCTWTERMPLASITAGRPELWMIFLYYSALGLWYMRRFRGKTGGAPDMCWACLGMLLLFPRPVEGLHIWFLDVGQGDGAVLQTAEGTILSDCGSSQDGSVGKNRLVPFLESRGICRLDYVLVSHSDQDHINGILWLLEEEPEIEVETLVLPMAGCGQAEYQPLVDAAEKRDIGIRYLSCGEQLTLGNVSFRCLHPECGRKDAENIGSGAVIMPDTNSQSLVFEVSCGAFSMLLTGDIGAGEERMLAEDLKTAYTAAGRRLTVLKVAHHGSAGSSSAEFLEAVRPELAILSYGEGNRYGHPAPETMERLEAVGAVRKGTAESGAIHLRTDGRRLWIRTFLSQRKSFYFPVDKKEESGL